ncbi:DNA double-strand break repair nuclease NurA [Candidatus Micrarchaeota archaeon]|nr:DNA double-strand break repair nuclease NurA [Candidatus Micrarchaeota archaeon]
MDQSFDKVIEELKSLEAQRSQAAAKARGVQTVSRSFLEQKIVNLLTEVKVEGRVCAVDGGILGEELHFVDLLLVRSAGACFDYKAGKKEKHEYYPSAFPQPQIKNMHALASHEFNWFKNLTRVESELDCAIDCVEKFSPNALFLDGSIVPHPADKPNKESSLYDTYERVIAKFKQLYDSCAKQNCFLAGVIKDSKGRNFLENLKENAELEKEFFRALNYSNDSSFLAHLLKVGERTSFLKYSQSELAVKDLGEWGGKINTTYIRAVEFDRPLRIDFLNVGQEQSEAGINLVYSLSKTHRAYGYPAVLIEADLRATLDPKEMEFACHELFSRLPSANLTLRRNNRPFR